MLRLFVIALTLCCLSTTSSVFAQSREEKVRDDRERVESEGFWIYNDLPKAFEEAEKTGKPILVVLRCIPCEECVKLDDELVEKDPIVRPLLDKFVCARQVSTNGIDLNLFQFDTDQSFAVFLLNADGTIYGRFGTRSHRTEWVGDVSLKGLAAALQGALELHSDYPNNKEALAGKRGEQVRFSSPEKYPSLKDKFTDSLNYSGNVVKSCIHCHQIGDAERDLYRAAGKPIPQKVLYPFPHPKVVGLTLDPHTAATVKSVEPGSTADRAGFEEGDEIKSLNGQPILSMADVQWVLHQTDPEGGKVNATIDRDGTGKELTLAVKDDWRLAGDIKWRVSSWGLRRMATGGMYLRELSDEDRAKHGIEKNSMALLAEHVGQYGPHGAAKKAGARKGDVIVAVDGRTDAMTEADLLRYGVTEKKAGEEIEITILRNGNRRKLKIPMQK